LPRSRSVQPVIAASRFVSFGAVVIDVVLFGGHDNATIIGPKIAF
jgi:hypothetical protein